LALIGNTGAEPKIIEYVTNPLNRKVFKDLIAQDRRCAKLTGKRTRRNRNAQ
jgi:hypothetical protein